jgi:molybdate transport system substrate-binding protein
MFARLGIAEQTAAKAKLAAGGPNGRVSVLVSSGEAEIGLQQVAELMSNPGVEVIGMLPPELQQITVYSAGITANAKEPLAARALIRFLAASAANAVYKVKGLAL